MYILKPSKHTVFLTVSLFCCLILHVQDLQHEIRKYRHQVEELEKQIRFYTNSIHPCIFYVFLCSNLHQVTVSISLDSELLICSIVPFLKPDLNLDPMQGRNQASTNSFFFNFLCPNFFFSREKHSLHS